MRRYSDPKEEATYGKGQQSSLFSFSDIEKKVYCIFCKERSKVVGVEGMYYFLKCGHVTPIDGNEELEKADKEVRQ